MSSKISSIHDAIYTMLASLFPNKKELTDGLVLENNLGINLKDGYGVSIEEGSNTERLQECFQSLERSIVISLTKEVFANAHDKTAFRKAEKQMLEDQYSLIMEVESTQALTDLVLSKSYRDDTGIERLFVEIERTNGTKQFLLTRVRFTFEYLEENV